MRDQSKKILIIGGTGFIGKNLRNYIEINTSHKVFAPSRQELDLLDERECKKYLEKLQPDYVVHSAVNIFSVEDSLKMFFNIYNLHYSYGKFIQLGSGAEYDRRNYSPMIEESLFGLSVPIDTYGMTKYLIARELISSNRESINLRLFGVYGKYEDYYRRFISNNICRSIVGLPLSINKNMYFDYIHVDDLSRLIVLLIDKINLKSNEYNFCTGKPISLKEIAMLICEEMQLETSVLIKEKGLNAEYSGSPKKILSEIGLFQFNDIKAEIKILVEYYKNILVDENLDKFKAKIHE